MGQFTSFPKNLADDSSQLDTLYLASNFDKLRTKSVAAIRKSKHYASTVNAWEKKLTGVDASDLAAVAKTLGFDVEVFNPLASSEPRTLFSGGGKSKRKAQLLKVKKDVYKPMKAGAIIDDPRFPPDMMRDVVGRLDPEDKSALLGVSRVVREDTMAVLPAQEKLWAAARSLNMEHVKQALEEGARVNKIDPSVGMNALKMIKGRSGSEALYEFLERQGAKPLNLEQINKHLARCVKALAGKFYEDDDSDADSDLLDWDDSDLLDNKWVTRMVREALLDGADPNTTTKYSKRLYSANENIEGGLLHVLTVNASENIDDLDVTVDTIKQLKSFGIDVNRVDVEPDKNLASGQTALHYACNTIDKDKSPQAGIRPAIVKALLESGIDVNKQDSRGETTLHKLAQYPSDEPSLQQEDVSLARLLLSHGADVSIINENGRRVIDYTEEYPDYVTYDPVMLDVLLRATEKREDFIQAVKYGNVESVKQFLREVVPVNTKDYGGDTLLTWSARKGHLEVVQALIEAAADVNAKDVLGSTPLHASAESEHVEVVRFLIEAGANVNAKNNHGWTPLHSSAWSEHLEISKSLIEAGADVNAKTNDGETPLHKSANVEVARFLIEAGADVSAENEKGQTPLHLSANAYAHATAQDEAHVNLEVTRLLIRAGANMNAEDRDGRTPLDIDPRLAEFRQNGVRPRQGQDDDQGQGRNVRQRVGGGGNTDVDVDLNADSRGTSYSEDDAALARAIEMLFGKMKNLNIKSELHAKLKINLRI